jgi:hypothetical protein
MEHPQALETGPGCKRPLTDSLEERNGLFEVMVSLWMPPPPFDATVLGAPNVSALSHGIEACSNRSIARSKRRSPRGRHGQDRVRSAPRAKAAMPCKHRLIELVDSLLRGFQHLAGSIESAESDERPSLRPDGN